MQKLFDIRVPLIILLNIFYIFILTTINNEVAPYFYIMLPAIFIVPPALLLRRGGLIFAVLFTSLILNAFAPVRIGLIAVLWLFFALLIHSNRFKFRSLDTFSLVSLMVLVNFIILLIYAIFFKSGVDGTFNYLTRVAIDVVSSSFLVICVAKFVVILPIHIMAIFGVDISIAEDG